MRAGHWNELGVSEFLVFRRENHAFVSSARFVHEVIKAEYLSLPTAV